MFSRNQTARRQKLAGVRRTLVPLALAGSLSLGVAACGSSKKSSTGTTTGGGSTTAQVGAVPTSTSFAAACGTKPVTLSGYFETGFPDIIDLTQAFTKQYPTVKWSIREDAFNTITTDAPLLLSGSSAPDLIRLPILNGLVKDHLLLNLDPYAALYGWDKFPASELAQNKTSVDGVGLGTGSLYAFGLNNQVTGVFYNKALAKKIGMTGAPKTLAQLEAEFAKAKAAGITPITVFNAGTTGGLVFPLQQLMADYGSAQSINDWVFGKTGATIDTPANVKAATVLESWIKSGYFNSDANAVLYAQMMSDFTAGKSLFIFDGDWESGGFDTHQKGQIGFFVMPPLSAGGKVAAMSGPLQYGVSAKAKNPACTAFFLNWVATNPTARSINVKVGGSNPGGPASESIPSVTPGSTTAATLAAGLVVAKDNGDMDFIANATPTVYAESWSPELQKLFEGQETPQGLLTTVQKEYQQQLSKSNS